MNPERVIKKGGEKEVFDSSKIKESVKKAAEQAGRENSEEIANEITEKVVQVLENKTEVNTSEIREIIMNVLTEKGYDDIKNAWEEYEERKKAE